MNERWTIQQLSCVVERALAASSYEGQKSGRVRQLPGLRAIRYYTTLGLLDKPAEMRGRRAFYTRRHALQLTAIKCLQARGLSLVELQQSLAGADDRQLLRWAGLTDKVWQQMMESGSFERGESAPPAGASERHSAPHAQTPSESASRELFWIATPQARPAHIDAHQGPAAFESTRVPRAAIHLPVLPNVELVIAGVAWSDVDEAERAEIVGAVESLAAGLSQLISLVPRDPSRSSGKQASHDPNTPSE